MSNTWINYKTLAVSCPTSKIIDECRKPQQLENKKQTNKQQQ